MITIPGTGEQVDRSLMLFHALAYKACAYLPPGASPEQHSLIRAVARARDILALVLSLDPETPPGEYEAIQARVAQGARGKSRR